MMNKFQIGDRVLTTSHWRTEKLKGTIVSKRYNDILITWVYQVQLDDRAYPLSFFEFDLYYISKERRKLIDIYH